MTTVDDDPQQLVEAEQRLFAAVGIEHRSARLPLTDAPVGHARVLEAGEGSPLLFLHGAGMSAALWAPLFVHLPHRRCLAVDLPGCGLSDAFDYRGVDLRDHARSFLGAVLDALELDDVPIVANSLGATFALYLAAAVPERVSRLVVIGAPGVALPGWRPSAAMRLYRSPNLGRLVSATSPPLRPTMARRILGGTCGRPAVDAMPAEMFEALAPALRLSEPTTRTLMPALFSGRRPNTDLALTDDELARIAAPVRFVWGRDDRFLGPEAGRSAAARMPDASLTEVPGGHHPWWDDATRCAELIEDQVSYDR